MSLAAVDKILAKLAALIADGRFEELETDTLEIKPVPSSASLWHQQAQTACAFLNTRGGIECDLTVARLADDHFYIVTGTGFRTHDFA